MNSRSIVATIVLALSLSACAATPYGDIGLTGGVNAIKTSADTYTIQAAGNSWTTVEAMKDFVYLKAAETTLAAGRTHFEVITIVAESYDQPVYASGVFMTVTKPTAKMTIKLHTGSGGTNMKDARLIAKTLSPKLKS